MEREMVVPERRVRMKITLWDYRSKPYVSAVHPPLCPVFMAEDLKALINNMYLLRTL
jgi:hypothetical protein